MLEPQVIRLTLDENTSIQMLVTRMEIMHGVGRHQKIILEGEPVLMDLLNEPTAYEVDELMRCKALELREKLA